MSSRIGRYIARFTFPIPIYDPAKHARAGPPAPEFSRSATGTKREFAPCLAIIIALLVPVALRAQGRIEGQVVNGTFQRPLGNAKVLLLSPRQGMELIAEATTDAQGHFSFAQAGIDPASFYLLQVNFQEVPYHGAAQFDSTGTATVNLTVYDSMGYSSPLKIRSLRVLVGALGDKVRVQEEYEVENSSRPPRTYANDDGTFVFHLSPQASEPKVSVTGLANMPLPQTLDRGKAAGDYKIRYPLKPGITPVTVTYDGDYSSAQFSLNDRTTFPIGHAEMIVFPSSLEVTSAVFKPAGTDSARKIQRLEAESFPRGASVEARLSGEAKEAPPSEETAAEGAVKAVPNTMTRLGVPVFVCFFLILLWALGVRASKEWSRWKDRQAATPADKQLGAKAEALFNSLANLDELFADGKIEKKKYWKERLELKAKLVAILKKGALLHFEPYAPRRAPR